MLYVPVRLHLPETPAKMSLESWQSIVAVKQASVRAKIPPEWHLPGRYLERVSEHSLDSVLSVPSECGLLSPAELTITEKYDAVSLLQQLAERVFTAEQVITAFSKRAAIAQQLVSYLSEADSVPPSPSQVKHPGWE